MVTFLTIGSDPEFFLKDKTTGKFVPSNLITSGTKSEPEDRNNGFLIHKDNLAIEGNIPPATNKADFINNMKFIKGIINTLAGIKNCKIAYTDEARFSKGFIMSQDGQEFGCSEIYNVWTKENRRSPELEGNIRTSGTHVHIGFELDNPNEFNYNDANLVIGRAFDLFLTLPSDIAEENSKYRRSTYGMYGDIRATRYGLECRSLGGQFAQDHYLPWIYDQTIAMFKFVSNPENFWTLLEIKEDLSNREAFQSFMERIYPEVLESNINTVNTIKNYAIA